MPRFKCLDLLADDVSKFDAELDRLSPPLSQGEHVTFTAPHESRLNQANLLKDLTDEPTKDWANALLPSDVLQRLKQTDGEIDNPK